jgi:hypothetical protein
LFGNYKSKKGEKMKRQKMSLETQLKGIKKAIDSPRTPRHLKPALGRRAVALEKQLKRKPSRGILGRLGF